MRINTLSQVGPTRCVRSLWADTRNSVFLAVKYGSQAMLKPNPSRGKEESGGSLILTASGAYIHAVISFTIALTTGRQWLASALAPAPSTVRDNPFHVPIAN